MKANFSLRLFQKTNLNLSSQQAKLFTGNGEVLTTLWSPLTVDSVSWYFFVARLVKTVFTVFRPLSFSSDSRLLRASFANMQYIFAKKTPVVCSWMLSYRRSKSASAVRRGGSFCKWPHCCSATLQCLHRSVAKNWRLKGLKINSAVIFWWLSTSNTREKNVRR